MTDIRTVQDVLNEIGFGFAQIRGIVCGGFVFFADGAELLLVGSVTRALKDEWELEPWQRGLVVSIVFIGILVGNLLTGKLSDLSGRRLPIILATAGIAAGSWASAAAWNFWSLTALRLIVGIFIGLGVPAYVAYYPEACSTNSRFLVGCISQSTFGLGSAYSGFLIYMLSPSMEDMNWRLLIMLGTIPAGVAFLLSLLFMNESPVWLANKGRKDDARATLDSMKRDNNCRDVDTEFTHVVEPTSEEEEDDKRWETLSRRNYFYTIIAMSFVIFQANFFYFGTMYALPQVLPSVSLYVSPAVNLIIAGLIEIPGFVAAYFIADLMNRKSLMLVYVCGCMVVCLVFSLAAHFLLNKDLDEERTKLAVGVILGSIFVGKIISSLGWCVTYLYVAEVFPPRSRTTAVGLVLAIGRLGSISCPLIYEYLFDLTNSFILYFVIMGVLSFISFFCILGLPIETFGADIDQDFGEDFPLNRGSLRKSSVKRLSSQFTALPNVL